MENRVILAVDLGASSGRVVAGLISDKKLRLEEVHRFENGAIQLANHLHWNLPGLWSEILQGLRKAAARYGERVISIGVDTWGVDFALLDNQEEILGLPVTYRDERSVGMMEKAFEIMPREAIFQETGLQFMELNTLYQLLAMRLQNSTQLQTAEHLLLMPDLFHWLLSGIKSNEVTNASTTQLYNPKTKTWSHQILKKLQLPQKIFGNLISPGTKLGPLRDSVQSATGLTTATVIVPATHDTASAVFAVPAEHSPTTEDQNYRPNWAYISSGTWSLVGIESTVPIITDQGAEWNFTNEAGVAGTTRVLKNIAGLWLVQECRRIWKQEGNNYDWSQLVTMAEEATPLRSIFNPDEPRLVNPEQMPKMIQELCREAGEPIPKTAGQIIRAALESLALRYHTTITALETLNQQTLKVIHTVGGGCKNKLLCQMTADICGKKVVAGPVEATAIGNVMVQAWTAGEVNSISEARQMIRDSFPCEIYEASEKTGSQTSWKKACQRFARF